MKKFLILILLICSMTQLQSSEQTTTVSLKKLILLENMLLDLKITINYLNGKIQILSESLMKAKLHSISSDKKMLQLEKSLNEALKMRDQFQNLVNKLQIKSIKLLESLNLSKQTISENTIKHVDLLEEVKVSHAVEIVKAELDGWEKFFIGAAIGLGTGAVVATIVTCIILKGNQ